MGSNVYNMPLSVTINNWISILVLRVKFLDLVKSSSDKNPFNFSKKVFFKLLKKILWVVANHKAYIQATQGEGKIGEKRVWKLKL